MDLSEQIYIKLQKHLNNQAVGFPATRSGAELKILKHIFTPLEAEITTCLSFRFATLEAIFSKVGDRVETPVELENILNRILKKGGVELKVKNGLRHYACAPLVVGMYEFQLKRLTPEFIEAFKEYTSDKNFGIEFLSTELPQMRTIPVAKSIHPQHNVSTFDEVSMLLQRAEAPFTIVECICRKKKALAGSTCTVTDRKETCLAIGSLAQMALESGMGTEITRDEALEIIELNQKEGLVLQPSNTERAEFICSCCGCCCGMLSIYQSIPRPMDYWASNYYAVVDPQSCIGCGQCVKSCQIGAVVVPEKKLPAEVDLERCFGCGLCVANCPTESILLKNKPAVVTPPKTREDLYEIIMAHKKGRIGKLKLTGKIVVDAIRTGHLRKLRS